MKKILVAGALGTGIVLAGLATVALTTQAEQVQQTEFNAEQKQAIEQIVRSYLVENPEVMLEVLTAMDAQQKKAEEQRQSQTISELSQELYNDPASYVAGNPAGDVTIVEFFDYKCGYCKRARADLMQVVEDDGNIRLVLKEFPILGQESVQASEAAIAAVKQDHYLAFHTALLQAKGALDEAKIMRLAEESGLDLDRLRKDRASPDVAAVIDRSYQLAAQLGVDGTPAFIIGDKLVPGALSQDRLRTLVEEARTACVSC